MHRLTYTFYDTLTHEILFVWNSKETKANVVVFLVRNQKNNIYIYICTIKKNKIQNETIFFFFFAIAETNLNFAYIWLKSSEFLLFIIFFILLFGLFCLNRAYYHTPIYKVTRDIYTAQHSSGSKSNSS